MVPEMLSHYRILKKLGAGGATMNAAFPSSALKVTGELRDYPSTADSGNKMHRKFCPTCGTHLFSEAEARPHLVFVRVGTLDNPEIAKPSATSAVARIVGAFGRCSRPEFTLRDRARIQWRQRFLRGWLMSLVCDPSLVARSPRLRAGQKRPAQPTIHSSTRCMAQSVLSSH